MGGVTINGMTEWSWGFLFSTILLSSFLLANYAAARGLPFHLTRKIAHLAAVIPVALAPIVFQSVWFPLGLTLSFLVLLIAAHNVDLFPGVVSKGRWSEVFFPLSLALCLSLWPFSPWLAVLPGIFLSLADGAAGIVRSLVYRRPSKGLWGSAVCLAVCLPFSVLVAPFWIGIAGAGAFTLAEWLCGEAGRIHVDDNLVAPVASAASMAVTYALV